MFTPTTSPRLIRIDEVCSKVGFCRAQIYRLIDANEFPSPIRLGPHATAWDSNLVDSWIKAKIEAGANQPFQKSDRTAKATLQRAMNRAARAESEGEKTTTARKRTAKALIRQSASAARVAS